MGEDFLTDVVELRGTRLVLRRCTGRDAADLCELIGRDTVLRSAAHMSVDYRPEPGEYLRHLARWCEKNRSITLAMVDAHSGEAIGQISLSHIDRDAGTGGIGYWLASARWGEGLTTEAFGLMLELAREMGLREVRAKVEKGNVASWKLWVRRGGTLTEEAGERYTCRIKL